MDAGLARASRGGRAGAAVIAAALALLCVSVAAQVGPRYVAAATIAVGVLGTAHRALLRWETLLTLTVGVIFLIPIKRYELPGSLPFHLEPYRLLIAFIAVAWLSSLLIDRRLRIRRTGLEAPLAAFAAAAVASVAVNAARLDALGLSSYVVKTLTFFASFYVLLYYAASTLRTRADVERLVRVMVGCGAVVAAAALVEYRTHDNLFNHLGQLLPALKFQDPKLTAGLDASYLDRSGGFRAYGSAAHPIELSAVLAMLLPLAVYLRHATGQRRWLAAALLLAMGIFATLSRTGIVMLVVVGFVFWRLRPVETRRMWPALIPALLVVYFAVPHTLGSLYAEFFPKGGLVAQQGQAGGRDQNKLVADGRLADIAPSLREWTERPLLGEGFGSRLTDAASAQHYHVPLARILDDQWLGSLLETGLVGVAALLWLFRRPVRRLKACARESDDDADAWLAVALVAAIDAYAVGMLTFDALGFVQVTLVLFLTLALASRLLATRRA